MIVNLVLFKYVCSCGHEFTAAQLPATVYGEFLMRSVGSQEERYLNALQDQVFLEFGKSVKSSEAVAGLSPVQVGKYIQAAFSIACDIATDGSQFKIGLKPKCPRCGSENMQDWSQVDPIQTLQKDLPEVTHASWNLKSPIEKAQAIESEIRNLREHKQR